MEEETLTLYQQLVDIIGLGQSGIVAYDIIAAFFFLTIVLVLFNFLYIFISAFLRR